jgi:hypothetical protein
MLPYKRQSRHLANTFAVANLPQKAIAPDFKNEKSGAFHLIWPLVLLLSERVHRKGVES